MARDLIFTVYGDDDVTPLFEVGTAVSHPLPYLHYPEDWAEAEVDFLEGRAVIGQVNVRVIDPQAGATQAERWITERLAVNNHSALIRRRAVLRYADGSAVLSDGVIAAVHLSDSYAGFMLEIKDVRERGRTVAAFTVTDTCTILPRGVLNGYGRIADAQGVLPALWLVPPVEPFPATFREPGAFVLDDSIPKADRVITQAIETALHTSPVGIFGQLVYDRVRVLWRPEGSPTGTPYTALENPPASHAPFLGGMYEVYPLLTRRAATVKDAEGAEQDVQIVSAVYVNPDTKYIGLMPADQQRVEVALQYVGPLSEQYPLHYEGPRGVFVRNLLRGDYSRTWDKDLGEWRAVNPRLRYDEPAILADDTPIRVRLTAQVKDIRTAHEQLCKAARMAPTLDDQGIISPISSALPPVDAVLPQIDDTNAQAIPGWSHSADNAVTAVDVTYYRDFRVPPVHDPRGDRSAADGIASRKVTVTHRAPGSVTAVMGEEDRLEIDAWMFRALGGTDGVPLFGDATSESGARLAEQAYHDAVDRRSYGGPVGYVRIMRSDFPALKVGDWVIDARSWVPNYSTGKRGANALAQIVSLKPGPAWMDARLDYAGPLDQPITAPTFGAPTIDAEGAITVPVIALPDGEAEVRYAIAAGAPATNSGAWLLFGRRALAGDITSSVRVPAGYTVWLQGRAVGVARRPSAWVALGSLDADAAPRLIAAAADVGGDGSVVITWTPSALTHGVRASYAVHAADAAAGALVQAVDADAASGLLALPAGTVGTDEAITLEIEPWTGWTGSAVSGAPGEPIRITRARRVRPSIGAAFWGAMIESGTVDLHLFVEGPSEIFPARAELYAGSPHDDAVVTHTFTASGQQIGPAEYPEMGDIHLTENYSIAWWAKITDALGGVTWVPAAVQQRGAASPDMAIKDLRIKSESATHVTYEFTPGVLLDKVHVAISAAANPPTWPAPTDPPTTIIVVGVDAHEFTVAKPNGANQVAGIVYGIDEGVDPPAVGPHESFIVRADTPPAQPYFAYFVEVPAGSFDRASVRVGVTDPGGRGGVLRAWVNHDGDSDPNPLGAADAEYSIASTPASVGPGEWALFSGIKKPLARVKTVWAEFVTEDGRSSGQQSLQLASTYNTLIDYLGAQRAGSVIDWMEWAPNIAPILRVPDAVARDALPNPIVGQRVILAQNDSLWKWNGAAWVLDYSTPTVTYAPALSAGIIKYDYIEGAAIDTVLFSARQATIDELNAYDVTITGKLSAIEADIDTLTANDVTITGRLSAAEADIGSLSVRTATIENAYITEATIDTLILNGTLIGKDGEFSGTVSANAVVAATTFTAEGIYCNDVHGAWLTASIGVSGGEFVESVRGSFNELECGSFMLNGQGVWVDPNGFLKVQPWP